MTAFSLLPPTAQHLLAELLFFCAMAQLAHCVYRSIAGSAPRRRVPEWAGFAVLFALCAHATAAMDYPDYPCALPWLLFAALILFVPIHALRGIRQAVRESRQTLSPASVRQALDNLDSGILFADATGRTVLVNRTMNRLAETLTGSDPQMLGELEAALRAPGADSGVEKLSDAPTLCRFPDGRVWRFQTVPLSDPALAGFTQTTAQDLTEPVEINERLARENAALHEANLKMNRMLARIADRIREEETLNLKMRIHDEIGSSLIALSELAAGGDTTDTDRQMRTLQDAVRCFSGSRGALPDACEDVCRRAEEMKVSLTLDGYLPESENAARLIVAAARECVTNCVRPAQGSRVSVAIRSRSGVCTVTITNDGAAPTGPITEGGGLSALRRSVERAGGEMHIAWSPRFALILNLPEREAAEE